MIEFNRLNSIFEATNRCSMAEIVSIDDKLGPDDALWKC